jgi:hypothetical protein
MHVFGVGTSHGLTRTHLTHHGPDSGDATTFPLIVFSAAPHKGYIQMALFLRTLKVESRNCPETVPKLSRFGLPGLWGTITSRPEFGSGRGLNQTCSSRRELSNVVSHSHCKRREEVDSWLLVVGSQTVSLTPGPSFDHNLGCRCPNGQCEASLDIYTSTPFQWHQEHPNARCFGLSTRALNFRESLRTPSSHFWECGLHPHT